MDALAFRSGYVDVSPSGSEQNLAHRPRNRVDTGLSQNFLEDLLLKHLFDGGVQDVLSLSSRMALAGPVVEEIIQLLRSDARVEVRGASLEKSHLRFALTDRGRNAAAEARHRDGYLGPAPVPLNQYVRIANAQSIRSLVVTRDQMRAAFGDVVIRSELLDEVGAAMNSGKAIFIYGPAGSGKTFICQRLARVIGEPILIPHAIAVGDTAIKLFDPVIHTPVAQSQPQGHVLTDGLDPRYVLSHRPSVITGGELTMEMLEVSVDPASGVHQAPLQLKAMNGIYMIDDLGRQRVNTEDLFNRWIVPMESRQDYLGLASGVRFPVPFDVALIFSTNLNPKDLADDAFLRRIGHKIGFTYLSRSQYQVIWARICEERGIVYDADLLEHTIRLHTLHSKPMLPCHPRDLLGMALDQAKYHAGTTEISTSMMDIAWQNYFVSLDVDPEVSTH